MTPSDDLSPPRRPIFFPVVIATVFLTIIGLTAGFVLGEQSRNRASASSSTPEKVESDPATPAGGPSPTFSEPVGPACPSAARSTAADLGFPEDIRQVFKIVTNKGSTVWICQDVNGDLYYQSKTGGEDADLVQGRNGLFLDRVRSTGENQYEAVADNGNRFVVNRKALRIEFTDDRNDQVDQVVRVG